MHNKTKTNTRLPQTMSNTLNHRSTVAEPPPYKGQHPKPPSGLNVFYWCQIFALESVVIKHKIV